MILSKKIKKLEASAPGLAAQQLNTAPQQQMQQQQQHQLQQQQQQQQQIQQQFQQQQHNILLQQRQRHQAAQHQLQAQQRQNAVTKSMAHSMATSSNSQQDDMSAMADMFLLNSAPPATSRPAAHHTATSQQLQHMQNMSRQSQVSAHPSAQLSTQLRQQQQQQLYQQQLQLQQRQQQQQLQQRQQLMRQQLQQPAVSGYGQHQPAWSQAMSSPLQQPHIQNLAQPQSQATAAAQAEQELNQRNLQQFWDIQEQLRARFFQQLQQLHQTPLLHSPLLDKKYRVRSSVPLMVPATCLSRVIYSLLLKADCTNSMVVAFCGITFLAHSKGPHSQLHDVIIAASKASACIC